MNKLCVNSLEAANVLNRVEKHMKKVQKEESSKKAKKFKRDSGGDTLASDDEAENIVQSSLDSLPAPDDTADVLAHDSVNVSVGVTFAGDDESLTAHNLGAQNVSLNDTLANDDGRQVLAHKRIKKKKRRFKRKYLQPQPKKNRRGRKW